jgi:hydrogenase maturation protease
MADIQTGLGGTVKSILILCGGHPFICDDGFGHHVANRLLKMDLPENVECMDCGYSASEFDDVIEGKDKMIFVDIFRTKDRPGTIVRFKPEEVPLTVDGVTDVPKLHLIELLNDISMSGKCPETVFIGIVPKEPDTVSEQLTPEIESKIPEVIDLIMEEIDKET